MKINKMRKWSYEDATKDVVRDGKESGFIYSIIPKGHQFKGNTVELSHVKHTDHGDTIQLRNNYYMGHSFQCYYINNNETELLYNYASRIPKYMIEKYKELEDIILTNTRQPADGFSYIQIEIQGCIINWTNYGVNIEHTSNEKGFKFRNNLHNIERLSEIKSILSMIKKVIRYNSMEDIFKNSYDRTVYNLETNAWDEPINVVKLNGSKLLNLKKQK